MAFDTSFDSKAWSGASGAQIGFAGDPPETKPWGFVTDPVHGTDVNPNGPNFAAQSSPQLATSTEILQGNEFVYDGGMVYDGAYGWSLDDLMFPTYDSEPGVKGHDSAMGPAQSRNRRGPDQAHDVDVYLKQPPVGYGVEFYGANPLKRDLNAWASSSTPAPNTKQFPAEAREETAAWPEPFNATNVAPWRPVDQSTEHIAMRRIPEDDRPVYRYIAVGPQNTIPTGNQWGVQYQSNVPVQNVRPVPMMPQTPVDPWITQENMTSSPAESTDLFDGWGLQ